MTEEIIIIIDRIEALALAQTTYRGRDDELTIPIR